MPPNRFPRPRLWVSLAALTCVLSSIACVLLAACGLVDVALLAAQPALVSGLALAVFDDLSSAT